MHVCKFFSKLLVDLEIKGVKGKNETRVAKKNLFVTFFPIEIFLPSS